MEVFGFFALLVTVILLIGLLGLAIDKSNRLEEENSRLRDFIRDLNIPGRDVRGRFTKRRPF